MARVRGVKRSGNLGMERGARCLAKVQGKNTTEAPERTLPTVQ